MNTLLWILLIFSGLGLVMMFLRRLRLTHQDVILQETMAAAAAEEEAAEEIPEATPAPEPEGGVKKAFSRADVLFSRGELGEAEPLLLSVVEADPSHLDGHHKLGLLYMRQGDFGRAELYFSKLVNLKKDPIYFSNLGAALYQQARLVEAAEAYENAIALDDRRAERLQSLAQVYFELGEDEKALHYFERAARRKPKDMELKAVLADYYEKLGRNEEAASKLEEILEDDPYNDELKKRLRALQK
jgi:tetratricopeptide (TPR) repeat protein